ncbi:unnamed protein product [Urochloa humidicola]
MLLLLLLLLLSDGEGVVVYWFDLWCLVFPSAVNALSPFLDPAGRHSNSSGDLFTLIWQQLQLVQACDGCSTRPQHKFFAFSSCRLQQPHLAVLSWFPANVQQFVQEIAKVLGLFAAGSIFMCTCCDTMAL